jgi:elongation factor Ts
MPEVTSQQVKALREMTSAGMMDCKRALVESGGDLERAKDWLREKGLARAAKKAGGAAQDGVIEAYVHAVGGVSKLGVLVEVNCETDFVARTDDFRTLARDIALQIAGADPKYVRREDVPGDVVERERNVFRAQVEGKPANIVEKIVEGKLDAFFAQVCLMDQPWIRDEKRKKKVSELVNEAMAKLGETVSVARFARYQLGDRSSEDGARAPEAS